MSMHEFCVCVLSLTLCSPTHQKCMNAHTHIHTRTPLHVHIYTHTKMHAHKGTHQQYIPRPLLIGGYTHTQTHIDTHRHTHTHTFTHTQYIPRPLLIGGYKFDLRSSYLFFLFLFNLISKFNCKLNSKSYSKFNTYSIQVVRLDPLLLAAQVLHSQARCVHCGCTVVTLL
jgi:hypothetical protein